jgi:hypothetical protein
MARGLALQLDHGVGLSELNVATGRYVRDP